MTEVKMTKAEQKRQEVLAKRVFIGEVFKDFIESYLRMLNYDRAGMPMTVTVKNDNHYIVFQDFGKCFKICIYTNGNVEIRIRDAAFDEEFREQLFEYSPDVEVQADFLAKIENGFADIIIGMALGKVISYEEFIIASAGGLTFAAAYDYCLESDDEYSEDYEFLEEDE